MAKQTFTTGQVLTAAQMTSLQQTAMGGGSTTAKTTSYVLVAADAGTVVQMNAAGATTITVNTALFSAGDVVFLQNIGAGVCTITAGTATVSTAGSLALTQFEGGQLYFTAAGASVFFDYIQAGTTLPLTTKGDVFGFDTANARIPIGANNTVLTADSAQALGLKWAAPNSAFSGVSIYKSANQAYTTGASSNVTFNTELYDTDSYHDTSTNTDRITIPTGKNGYYLLQSRVAFVGTAGGQRIAMIRKNAAATQLARNIVTGSATNDQYMTTTCVVNLVATDYVVVEAYQDSVGTIDLIGNGQQYSSFTAVYLGA